MTNTGKIKMCHSKYLVYTQKCSRTRTVNVVHQLYLMPHTDSQQFIYHSHLSKHLHSELRPEIQTVVVWVWTPCSLFAGLQCFRGTWPHSLSKIYLNKRNLNHESVQGIIKGTNAYMSVFLKK